MLLQRPDEAFRTAVALGCADKGRRAGVTQKRPFLLKHMRHLWTAMIMTEHQALSDVVPKRPQGSADTLADWLQRFKPRRWRSTPRGMAPGVSA